MPANGLGTLDGLLRTLGVGDRQAAACSLAVVGYAAAYLAERPGESRDGTVSAPLAAGRAGAAAAPKDRVRRLAVALMTLHRSATATAFGAGASFRRARDAVRRARCLCTARSPQDTVRMALYVLRVAETYRAATGMDPEDLTWHRFEPFLVTSLRLIDPAIGRDIARALHEKVLGANCHFC
jgi:hypothetical protein